LALDTEVVFGLACQGTVTRPRLQQPLRQGDGSRNAIVAHFAYGDVLVGLDVFFGGYALRNGEQRQQNDKQKANFLHTQPTQNPKFSYKSKIKTSRHRIFPYF
jgi:hypothetical protein